MENTLGGTLVKLSDGYYLEREEDVLVLRGDNGLLVAAFSLRWVAGEAGHKEVFTSLRETLPPVFAEPGLRVNFFGRFELLRGGEEVVCLGGNTRALAILKYLLARRGGQPVPAGSPHGLVVA